MRFRRVVILQHCPSGVRGRLGPYFSRGKRAVVSQEAITVRKTGVGFGVLRVFCNSFFEELNRLAKSLFGALVHVIAALHIKVVSRQVLGGPRPVPGPTFDLTGFETLENG